MVGKAGDSLARDSRVARVRIAALALFLARAFLPVIALDEWMVLCACRVRVVVRRAPEADYDMPRVT